MNTSKIDRLFRRVTSSATIHEGALLIENSAGDRIICKEYHRTLDTPMLMASITKLFTTTCVLALLAEGKLSLADKLPQYLSDDMIRGLHIYKGQEYSFDLCIAHLLFQTSGLPDFYLNGADAAFSKIQAMDFSFSFEEELRRTKALKPRFAPGSRGKAYYADVNFDLLGKVIEAVSVCTLKQAYDTYIIKPLGLKNTYLAAASEDFVPHTYCKKRKIERPQFVRSCYASGGCVTTARELMLFMKAFYGGKLFDKATFSWLETANPLQMSFYPICYAGGFMLANASYPFGKKVKLVGHSGSTGSFAFYAPDKDLFFVGDLSQIASPAHGVRLVMQAALAI